MNAQEAMSGFGIPLLHGMVRDRMRHGLSLDDAIAAVADYAELRSEAIEVLRASFNGEAPR